MLSTRAVRNLIADLRAGHLTAGEFLRQRPTPDSRHRGNTDHLVLEQIFADRVQPGDVLVDVGCGRGRVLGWWRRTYPDSRVVGIELNAQVFRASRRRFRRDRQVEILEGDATELIPADGSLFYLFNPFDGLTTMRFAERLLEANPSSGAYRVLYHNPKHLEAFEDRSKWAIESIELTGSRFAPFHGLACVTPVSAARPSERPL